MSYLAPSKRPALAALAACFLASSPLTAATTFDFEGANPLGSPLVSGDKVNFAATTEQAKGGTRSLKFVDPAPGAFENFTYDVEPTALTSGTISVWFYDVRGLSAFATNPANVTWGGSIILEDKNNPSDFVAIEIADLPYGGGRYYATEGSVDRAALGDKFDSSVAGTRARSVGFHQVVFSVGPTASSVSVDGITALEVGGPGGDKTLRLRFMDGSASNGGAPVGTPGLPPGYQPNWYLTPAGTEFAPASLVPWVYYDDIAINAQAPAASTHTCGFESGEYDTFAVPFPVPVPANDNPRMNGFVNQWDSVTSGAVAHGGTNAAYFRNAPPAFRSVAFDLTGATSGSQATLWFYDALGNDGSQTKFGGSILVQSGLNASEFLSAEIWNFPYPASSDPTPGAFNYFLCPRPIPGTSSGFESRVFGNRSVGWHQVVITLYDTYSTMAIDGFGSGAFVGPGLDKNPKLRLMADSASSGGFSNYTSVDPLQHVYFATLEPYVYYDDIVIPATSGIGDWSLYQ